MLQPINNARTLSGPGFQDLNIWLSGPGFQDLESSPSYGRLIFFPSLFFASSGHRQTDAVWNPGPKIEIPHPENHVLKVFRFRSWKPRVWKYRPQSWDPKSWKPCPENHILRFWSGYHAKSDGSDRRTPGPPQIQKESRGSKWSKCPNKHHSGRLLWQSTGCWSIRLEISGTNCSSGSGSGPVTTQRVTGRTDARTDALREFIYKILHNIPFFRLLPTCYFYQNIPCFSLSNLVFNNNATSSLEVVGSSFIDGVVKCRLGRCVGRAWCEGHNIWVNQIENNLTSYIRLNILLFLSLFHSYVFSLSFVFS